MKKKNMILLAGALAASMLIGGCSKEKTESETTGSPAQGARFPTRLRELK